MYKTTKCGGLKYSVEDFKEIKGVLTLAKNDVVNHSFLASACGGQKFDQEVFEEYVVEGKDIITVKNGEVPDVALLANCSLAFDTDHFVLGNQKELKLLDAPQPARRKKKILDNAPIGPWHKSDLPSLGETAKITTGWPTLKIIPHKHYQIMINNIANEDESYEYEGAGAIGNIEISLPYRDDGTGEGYFIKKDKNSNDLIIYIIDKGYKGKNITIYEYE